MSDFNTSEYFQLITEKHRRDLGQFFTHSDVAGFMVQWVLGSGQRQLYDPAFGLGAFRTPFVEKEAVAFTACEIDADLIAFLKKSGMNTHFITKEDYLLSWGKRHTNIICNPPYMRFQKFLNRDAVFEAFSRNLGCRLSGYTNTASAFLLKSISEMDGTGRLAYIMPMEFLNTGYGTDVKIKLLEGAHLAAMISIDCEKDVFPDATTSVGIVLYDAAKRYSHVDFYSLGSIAELSNVLERPPTSHVAMSELKPETKWLSYFQEMSISVDPVKTVALNYYGRFSRGIATGANEFFVLQKSSAREKGFLSTECVPCITRSSQLDKPVFEEKDFLKLLDDDGSVLLFSANGNPSLEAMDYIKYGQEMGYHTRFLTKNRKPWYKTELRTPSPLLLGVFSRGGYKIILNRSKALNLTCYHGFQPNLFGLDYIDHLFLYFLSKTGRSILSLSMRKYGDALDKFEPNDLNSAMVPTPEYFDCLSAEKIALAIRHVEETDNVPYFIEEFFAELTSSSNRHDEVESK